MRASLSSLVGADTAVELNSTTEMTEWNRPTSQVDVLVRALPSRSVEIAIELKAWDVSHQLFDLAKVCCLLAAGAGSGFLVCVAKREADFSRQAGGELFAARGGEIQVHDFVDLVQRHSHEWRKHFNKGRPEPTSIPIEVATTAVADPVAIRAYPGHSARGVEVTITDPERVPLLNGHPGAC